jgi:hypothetical protein
MEGLFKEKGERYFEGPVRVKTRAGEVKYGTSDLQSLFKTNVSLEDLITSYDSTEEEFTSNVEVLEVI